MKVHGKYGWTAQFRAELAAQLLKEISVILNQKALRGGKRRCQVLTMRARMLLVSNADILDKFHEQSSGDWLGTE